MLRRSTAVAFLLAAALGVTACGDSEQTGDVIPGDTPELVPPGEGAGTLPAATSADSGDSGDSATTGPTGVDGTTLPDSGGTAPAPSTQATPVPQATAAPQATPTPSTGGAGAGGTAGGTGGEAGGFQDFCTQNPGACDN